MSGAGMKHDGGKPRLSLIPGVALLEIAEVLEYGARKYAEGNWKQVRPLRRYLDAALRHLHAVADGEDLDPESGLPHLAHAGCSILFLLAFRALGEVDPPATGCLPPTPSPGDSSGHHRSTSPMMGNEALTEREETRGVGEPEGSTRR